MRFAFAAMVAYDRCPGVEGQRHILRYSQAGDDGEGAMLMTVKVDSRKARCPKRVDVRFRLFLSIEPKTVRSRAMSQSVENIKKPNAPVFPQQDLSF